MPSSSVITPLLLFLLVFGTTQIVDARQRSFLQTLVVRRIVHCTYEGEEKVPVDCAVAGGAESHFKPLMFINNQVSGVIPPILGSLGALQLLEVRSNRQLRGTIPTQLAGLTSLQSLTLASNPLLFGSIPSQLGLLTALTELRLRRLDVVTGSIPASLSALTSLKSLDISLNARVRGRVPAGFSALRVAQLLLNNNALTGPLPATLVRLPAHRTQRLHGNALCHFDATSVPVTDACSPACPLNACTCAFLTCPPDSLVGRGEIESPLKADPRPPHFPTLNYCCGSEAAAATRREAMAAEMASTAAQKGAHAHVQALRERDEMETMERERRLAELQTEDEMRAEAAAAEAAAASDTTKHDEL
jgi:hypothetical protein